MANLRRTIHLSSHNLDREWIRKDIIEFAKANPEVAVKTELKRAHHPFLRGVYKNGNSKTICVKNLQPTDIQKYAAFLRNQIGRRVYLFIVLYYGYGVLEYLILFDCVVDEQHRVQVTRAEPDTKHSRRVARENGPDWFII